MNLLVKSSDINIEFSGREILDIKELNIYSYDRIGLIGENGSGKTTLMKILLNKISCPGSKITCHGNIAYIPQQKEAGEKNNENLSGGEAAKTKIASALSQNVHGIFADEPTCHLDFSGIESLIAQLNFFDGAYLLISHDRYFLDHCVNKIWELKEGKITEYWGNYSDYLFQKEEESKSRRNIYEQVLGEKARLEKAAAENRILAAKSAKKASSKKSNESKGRLGHEKSAGSKEKKLYAAAKNMEKKIKTLNLAEPPEKTTQIKFRNPKILELNNKFPVAGKDIYFSYKNKIIFENASFVLPLGSKTALTGNNGCGKTTLLNMIFNFHESLTISPKAIFGRFTQKEEFTAVNKSILSYMQENCCYELWEIRSALAAMGFEKNDVNKPLSVLSGGELTKLRLTKMLLGQYNILLIDEPGNYLDTAALTALESMIKSYAGTVLYISHDKYFIKNTADNILEIKNHKIYAL